jgi:hypothetical protein
VAQFKFGVFVNLIRALFPKWNFFDRTAFKLELYFRLNQIDSWQKINFDQKHKFGGLFFNPNCNISLAHFNIVEHFAADVQGQSVVPKPISDYTSYHLIKSLLSFKVLELGLSTPTMQFKIIAINQTEEFDLYLSEWLAWN